MSGPRDPEIHLRLRAADSTGMNASFLRADVDACLWALNEIELLRSMVHRLTEKQATPEKPAEPAREWRVVWDAPKVPLKDVAEPFSNEYQARRFAAGDKVGCLTLTIAGVMNIRIQSRLPTLRAGAPHVHQQSSGVGAWRRCL